VLVLLLNGNQTHNRIPNYLLIAVSGVRLSSSLEASIYSGSTGVRTASYLKIVMAGPGGATHLKVDGRASVLVSFPSVVVI
jgi:hypothetical protein